MYYGKEISKLTLRPIVVILVGVLMLGLAGYWQQSASAASPTTTNASIPPGTIPGGPTTPADKAKITVIHAAPFDANVDNTAVDVCTQDGTVVSGLAGLKYLYNASILVDPGSFDLKIADAGSNCLSVKLDLAPFTLIAQQEVVLVITGDGTNQPVDALLFLTNAGVRTIYLPIVAKS